MNLEDGIPEYLDQTDLNSSELHDNHPEVPNMYLKTTSILTFWRTIKCNKKNVQVIL